MITRAHTPNTATDHPPPCGRRGVALIIVLGLLGLLLISAVSFAVLMRTERNAATNYRHTSSARQMLHAGLARAIEDINADIGEDLCPAWTNRTVITGSFTNKYPESMFFSRYTNTATGNDPVPARLLTKDVMTYIPVLYHRRLTENIYASPEWIPITYSNSTLGRYAYAVIDSSGLLDAHLVYDSTTNRWLGTSPKEIRLDTNILSRKDLINVASFTADRTTHKRYETVSELATLNSGIDTSKLANFEVFSRYSTNAAAGVTNINLFGLTTNQLADAAVRAAITKGFTDSGCTGTAPLTFPALTREDILYAALADYLDSDSVMNRPYWLGPTAAFSRPCTEKLPLLTSYGVTVTYTRTLLGGTNYVHNFKYEPIINYARWPVSESSATDLSFLFKGAICFTNTALDITNSAVSPSGSAKGVCKSSQSTSIDNSFSAATEQNIFLGSATFNVAFTNTTTTPLQPKFDLLIAAEVYTSSGVMCYQFPGDKMTNEFSSLPPTNYHTLFPAKVARWAKIPVSARTTPPGWSGTASIQTNWAECVDPRFAYSKDASSRQWYSYSTVGSAADLNSIYPLPLLSPARYARKATPLYVSILTDAALAEKAGLSSNRMDGCYNIAGTGMQYDDLAAQLKMHVANAPLQTPGELSYLLCGPWETVRLYDHFPFDATTNDYHRVLDYFEVRDPSVVPTGKVNLNNAPVDVLALLYLGMPLRSENAGNYKSSWKSDGTDAARPLTAASALPQTLATNLYNGLRANGPVRGLSALANVYSAGRTSAELLTNHLENATTMPDTRYVGEFEREAVIRNLSGLLTVKQQMFTIILRADAFTTRFGSDKLKDGTVLSSATAIAQVYRDAAPPHKVTVRLLKILE
jgi:Tfp pilus assembly protein PilX